MKKFLLFLLTLTGVVGIFSGCKKEEQKELNSVGPFLSSYVYGFSEECSDGANYCTVQSMEITASYSAGNAARDSGSGYFVILGLDTSLSDEDMSLGTNVAELVLPCGEKSEIFLLNLLEWDTENKKLIYEIPNSESIDYQQLCGYRIADDSNVAESTAEPPYLRVTLQYFCRECVIGGYAYDGRVFILDLE